MTRLKTIMMCCSASTVLSGSELPDIVIAEQKEPAYLIMSSSRGLERSIGKTVELESCFG